MIETGKWVVIMARGQSLRLGYPKGLARLKPDGPTLLEVVEGLYRQAGFHRLGVPLPDLAEVYGRLLEPDYSLHWLTHAAGGDTGLTLQVAWEYLANRQPAGGSIWAHPVDLPLVRPETLELLDQASRANLTSAVRPVYRDDPGHPVVFPRVLLERIFDGSLALDPDAPMRSILAQAGEHGLVEIPVSDQGVVHDFDDPTAFQED